MKIVSSNRRIEPSPQLASEAPIGKLTDGDGATSTNHSWLQSYQARQKTHPPATGSSQAVEASTPALFESAPRDSLSRDAIGILRGWRTALLDIGDDLLAEAGLRVIQPPDSARAGRQGFNDEEVRWGFPCAALVINN